MRTWNADHERLHEHVGAFMIAFTRIIVAIGTLVAALSTSASAQSVRGDLRDRDRNRVLPAARLYLIDAAGNAVDSTRTQRGRFRLSAPAGGAYTVYFHIDGWASVPSGPLRLVRDSVVDFEFRVPLIHHTAIRQLGAMIDMDARLQSALPEICGEPLRLTEAGLLVGVVRARATRQPLSGARVSVAARGSEVARATVSSNKGIYILCNVPLGTAVAITVESAEDSMSETTEVEIRAGTVSWYDLPIGPRR